MALFRTGTSQVVRCVSRAFAPYANKFLPSSLAQCVSKRHQTTLEIDDVVSGLTEDEKTGDFVAINTGYTLPVLYKGAHH